MDKTVPHMLLAQLGALVEERLGLHFPRERWSELAYAVSQAARELGFANAQTAIQSILTALPTKRTIEVLANHLTVGETYFFRDRKIFEVLEKHILPDLIGRRSENGRRLRIWSAGCSSGEEPYSVALILHRMLPSLRDWNVTLLGTDINKESLRKAVAGQYGEWSFRDTDESIKTKFFSPHNNGRFEIAPRIKSLVQFSYLNLAEDTYPSLLSNTNAMDIILCRNVLMYFTQERARAVVHKLYCSLLDDGWLLVSPSEASNELFSQFVSVNLPDVILYRKAGTTVLSSQRIDVPKTDQAENTAVTSASHYPPRRETLDAGTVSGPAEETPVGEASLHRITGPAPDEYGEVLALYEQGAYVLAEGKIAGLLSVQPDNAKLMALLARILANTGRLDEAREWAQKANTIDKLNPVYRYMLFAILQESGRTEEATWSLTQTLYLDPSFVLAHYALGNFARQRGKAKEAEKHFQRTLNLLSAYRPEDVLPESEGMTAGRLAETIRSAMNLERAS